MAAVVKDHFIDLERHRRQLGETVAKLQQALQYWRMSDAEYEQLKEEVEAIRDSPTASRQDLERIQEEFEGEVVTNKEVEELFFGGNNQRKTPTQIISILSRRIDYVSKNVETLEKQLAAAEQKLVAATVVVNPDVRDEEGLPITDIIEQLDDDDNVTTYRLQRPGDLQPQIQEALAKAGIDELPEGGEEAEAEASTSAQAETQNAQDEDEVSVEMIEDAGISDATGSRTYTEEPKKQPESKQEQPSTKKGVSFAEDTKPGHDSATDAVPPLSKTAQRLGEIMEQAREQALPIDDPIIPQEESAEDAELRREMLKYSMEEIAPIVAELEIDEEGNSDFDDAYEFEEEDYSEEDEDEHGRYKYRVVNDDYRARMEELQQKLGIKSMRELAAESSKQGGGEEDDDDDDGVRDEGIGRITIQPQPQVKSALKTDDQTSANVKPAKKGVKFASALDVSPAPDSSNKSVVAVSEPEEPFVDPMKTTIVERSALAQATTASETPAEPKKVSRFKKAKAAAAGTTNALPVPQTPAIPKGPADAPVRFLGQEEVRTAPTGPEGKTLAGTILERETPVDVKEPDEFDAALLHQEAATEYHRMRNRMILKEGGFTKETESPIEYPEEEEGSKRISRFKAARLARQ